MARSVNIYKRQGKVLVVPVYRIEGGGYVEKGPVHVIEDGNWPQVGEAVLQALTDYREGLPMPDWSQILPVARAAVGATTVEEFEQDLVGCFMQVSDTDIKVTPD